MRNHILPVIIIITIILCGYNALIFGGHCYLYQDPDEISYYSYKNTTGNGWWPDRGFGISAFFGDPGKWHPWSPFVLWEKMFSSRGLAYGSSIVILDVLAAVSLYFFMIRIIPGLGNIPACMLSVMIVFGSGQAPSSFNRIWISLATATPLLLMLLYNYYKRPRILHLFLAALLFFFTIFFGNIWALTSLMSLGLTFSAVYLLYFKERFWKFLSKFISIYAAGGLGALFLGCWIFYSILVDYGAAGGYMREKMSVFPHAINLVPDIKNVAMYIGSIFQIEWLPVNLRMIGAWPHGFLQGFNISAVFPLVFIFFLFRRSANFWEHAFKVLLVIFYIFQAVILMPTAGKIYNYLCWSSKTFITIYGFENIAPLQILLIGMFIYELKRRGSGIGSDRARMAQRLIAAPLFLLYSGIAIFCLFALLAPAVLPNAAIEMIGRFSAGRIGASLKEVISYVVSNNISLAQQAMGWHSFVFFSLTAFLVSLFFRDGWLKTCAKRPLSLVTGTLAISGILLSWTIYPLSKDTDIWQKVAHLMPDFKPTDRFYFVNDTEGYGKEDPLERLSEHKRRVSAVGGLREHLAYKVGIHRPPGLHLSGYKHFTQKNVGDFIYHIFNGDGVERLTSLRDLTTGGPVFSSDLLDMGAVSYYYSTRKILNLPKNLSPYAETDYIYIYRNLSAWPYFYLADRLEIQNAKHLKDVRRGTAYLTEEDFFAMPEGTGRSSIELKEFSHGRMVFDYRGDKENLLVVADAWHPFWKARAGERALTVIKANEIFKAVRLPKGEYTLDLFFDTSPFFTGIYVSAITWMLFLPGLVLAAGYRRRILTGHLKTDRRYE